MSDRKIFADTGENRWLPAGAAALLINLVLLSVLPVINLGTLSPAKSSHRPESVNFVRLAPPESFQQKPPAQQRKPPAAPQTLLPPPPDVIDLSSDSLKQVLRPDLHVPSFESKIPGLTDMPLATLDFGAAGLDGVFEADELDKPLIPVSRVPPFYPLQARRAGIEGEVKISFLVNEQGRVEDIRILNARPPDMFEKSVRRAVSGWRFQPGTIMGEPVRARVTTSVVFKLEENR